MSHTLDAFVKAVIGTVPSRRQLVTLSSDDAARSALVKHLQETQVLVAHVESHGVVDGQQTKPVDASYELAELEKDLIFLTKSAAALDTHFASLYTDFEKVVAAGLDILGKHSFRTWVTDRDGTINNYCGRYSTSVQSVYNASYLRDFAKLRPTACNVVLTSAPLQGLVGVSAFPDNTLVYAGSKGREYICPYSGKRKSLPIPKEQQERLDRLNEKLEALVNQPEHTWCQWIGSGLQFKFGQSTVAFQDHKKSIPQQKVEAIKAGIQALVKEVDPKDEVFRLEDTGMDLEILLTVKDDSKSSDDNNLRDFDKGDGVLFLEQEIKDLDFTQGPNLVCGDTGSDVAMLKAVVGRCANTYTIFATTKAALRDRVKAVCPNAFFVDHVDELITILGRLAKQ